MKITIFIGGLSKGGAERVVCNLANYLTKRHSVSILTMSDDEPSYSLSSDIQRISLIKQEERNNAVSNAFLRLKRLLNYIKHSNDNCYLVMLPVTTELLLFFKSFTKAKVIVSERNDPVNHKPIHRFLIRVLAHRADGYVFQTNEEALWYKRWIKKTRTTIIPNAINSDFLGEIKENNSLTRVVSAGRLSPQKNFSLLIRAFEIFHKEHPEYTLDIFGEGSLKNELEKQISDQGLVDSVRIHPFTKNLKNELKNTKMFVLASNYEGMPNVLMEAMALGVPCVSTNSGGGGAKALIDNEVNGLLIPVGDEVAMASAMKRIAENDSFANYLGQSAMKIQVSLAPNVIYRKWEQYIESVCN